MIDNVKKKAKEIADLEQEVLKADLLIANHNTTPRDS